MRSRKALLICAVGSAAVMLVAAAALIAFIPDWLQSGDRPVKSDAVVILAGEPLRAFYAADLFAQGYAHRIYISRPAREYSITALDNMGIVLPKQEEIYRLVLLKKGVPDKDIHFFGKSSVSTVEEADALREVFKGGQCSLLIVTSFYHSRRAKMIFRDTLKGCNISVVGTPYEPLPEKWWTNQDAARNVILEIAKILYFKAGGRFMSPA